MPIAGVFALSLAIIVLASELFTNAVEWLGYRLRLGTGATGSLLAALGTSLPEFFVPVVALTFKTPDADRVAMGAVLGAPLLLLTLGTGLTGIALLARRQKSLTIDASQVRRDLGTFVVGFSLVLVAMRVGHSYRLVIGALLLAIYAAYVLQTLRGGEPREEMPEPLHLLRLSRREEGYTFIGLQLLIGVGMLIGGSSLFVQAIHDVAAAWNWDALVVAIVLVPVATELPETFNSILWIRKGDDGLAFGNVAGSATFQACILGFIGVSFTTWSPGGSGSLSAAITMGTALVLLALLFRGRRHGGWLALAILPWGAFVAAQTLLSPVH